MKKSIINLGVILLLCTSMIGCAQTRRMSASTHLDCNRMVELSQSSVELTLQGKTMSETINQLFPSAPPHISDEIFVMLVGLSVSDDGDKENIDWDGYHNNCLKNRNGIVDAVNEICSGFSEMVGEVVSARDAGYKSQMQVRNVILTDLKRSFGVGSKEWALVKPIVERIVRREVHTVYTNPEKGARALSRDLEQRCMLR